MTEHISLSSLHPPRRLGQTDMYVTPVAMGCWPITGITSVDVTREASLQTLRAAYDAGINFFDTAYVYGYEGESEQMIATALGDVRDKLIIASKCGIHWGPDRKQVRDARPERIREECETSLRRLQTDVIDLYYLHAPDPEVPVEESAGAIRELLDAGKIRAAGVSNFSTLDQYKRFQSVCPITADQPHYNMLQREIEAERLPWCHAQGISVVPYWPLMKGFLAGKLPRNHQWDSQDGRQKYPIFQGDEWSRSHDFLDKLRPIAEQAGVTLAQLAVLWVIRQSGITAALCGAKRPEQILETASALKHQLNEHLWQEVQTAIESRGVVNSRPAVQ